MEPHKLLESGKGKYNTVIHAGKLAYIQEMGELKDVTSMKLEVAKSHSVKALLMFSLKGP